MSSFGGLATGMFCDVSVLAVCVLAVVAFHNEVMTYVNQFAGIMVPGFIVHRRWGVTGVEHFDETWGCSGASELMALGAWVTMGAWAGWSLVVVLVGVAGGILLLILSLGLL